MEQTTDELVSRMKGLNEAISKFAFNPQLKQDALPNIIEIMARMRDVMMEMAVLIIQHEDRFEHEKQDYV